MKKPGYCRAFSVSQLLCQRLAHLLQDRLGGFGGVGRLGDRAADHQVAGALAKGFRGSGDALLVCRQLLLPGGCRE